MTPLQEVELATEHQTGKSYEPVPIPVNIQSDGSLIAFDMSTSVVQFASENIARFLQKLPRQILGNNLNKLLHSSLIHSIKNGIVQAQHAETRIGIGTFEFNKKQAVLYVYVSESFAILEFCPCDEATINPVKLVNEINSLIQCVEPANSPADVLGSSVRVLRFFTGYDRIVALQAIDRKKLEVIAECKRSNLAPYSWLSPMESNIQESEIKIMSETPLSAVFDVDQVPISLRAANDAVGLLDISKGLLRNPSATYKQHLFGKEAKSSISLSVTVDGKLWGFLALLHSKPKIPSYRIQETLLIFRKVLSQKLATEIAKLA